MQYAAVETATFKELTVTAVTTAGVHGNAGRAGDPATWHEESEDVNLNSGADIKNKEKNEDSATFGTINTLLFINWPLTEGAMAKAVVTLTEAKSAALGELAVPSRYSNQLATGTGTDQYTIAALADDSLQPKAWSGMHSKLGELIGTAVKKSVREALRWQNGLKFQ